MQANTLRKQLRARRNRLGLRRQRHAAYLLAAQFRTWDFFKNSRNIAIYLAADGELSCHELIKLLWMHGKRCYVPIINRNNDEKQLSFSLCLPGSLCKKNRLGILEPQSGSYIKQSELDAVVMPLVGVDLHGNRLGMGGGFYDRTFAFRQHTQRPILIGIGHQCQRVRALSPSPWDVRPDRVHLF